MGYQLDSYSIDQFISEFRKKGIVYGPKLYKDEGRFSDTDIIRYGEIEKIDELVFDKKSDYSFKEILNPITQTLFYFTENEVKEPDALDKEILIFMRSCDIHALKRLDDIYIKNGYEDYYYTSIRNRVKIALIGCKNSFENCFCVSMKSNISIDYDFSIDMEDEKYNLDIKNSLFKSLIKAYDLNSIKVTPSYVEENNVKVSVPQNISIDASFLDLWREYDSRCIDCGRCNFVCPTCTCFTMQDIFYKDNGKVGERRRIWASCMVDGFTDVAGGESYRQKSGDRMRFKVLHKIYDFKKRNGYHMCVGCGNCDSVCPEYISFSNCINKLNIVLEGDE